MMVYNLKRVTNIPGIETLLKKLKTRKIKCPGLLFFEKNRLFKGFYMHDYFSLQKLAA